MSQTQPSAGTKPKVIPSVIVGIVFIAVGIWMKTQPWVKPPMFKAIDLDLAIVVMNIGVFVIWIAALHSFFYKPLEDAMENRTSALEATFSEAENLRVQMNEIRASYEKRLADTEAEARTQIQAQLKEAQELRQKLMGEAAAKYDAMMAQAEADVSALRAKASEELRKEVVGLTLKATERLLGENVDNARNRALVEEFVSKAGAAEQGA